MAAARIIIVFVLGVSAGGSFAFGIPMQRLAAPQAVHDCCKKHQKSNSMPVKGDRDGGPCPMPCCRIIPAPIGARPILLEQGLIGFAAFCPVAPLHPRIERDGIFHPPRI